MFLFFQERETFNVWETMLASEDFFSSDLFSNSDPNCSSSMFMTSEQVETGSLIFLICENILKILKKESFSWYFRRNNIFLIF